MKVIQAKINFEFSASKEIHSFLHLTEAVVNVAMPPTNETQL